MADLTALFDAAQRRGQIIALSVRWVGLTGQWVAVAVWADGEDARFGGATAEGVTAALVDYLRQSTTNGKQ